MTIQTAVATPATKARSLDTNLFDMVHKIQLPATAQNDSQLVVTMPTAGRMTAAHLRVPASLGAGATAKLQKRDIDTGNAVDITAATTAATAGVVASTGLVPIDFKAGDTIELLVSGGALSAQASANVEIDLTVQRA